MYIEWKFGIRALLSVNYISFMLKQNVTKLLGIPASFSVGYTCISFELTLYVTNYWEAQLNCLYALFQLC